MDISVKKKIFLDTNIFFIPIYDKIDVIEELKIFLDKNNIYFENFYTTKKNVWEIENKINTSKSEKNKKLYEMALKYLKSKNVIILDSDINERTDRLIVKLVLKEPKDWIVFTRDKILKNTLKSLRISYITYSNKKFYIKIF